MSSTSSSSLRCNPDTRKSVLITGAGVGGIGGELAKQFYQQGYRVFAAARRLETVHPLEDLGIEGIYLDVTDPSSIAAARDTISELTGGRLHVLVNNAGQAVQNPATDLEIETVVKQMFDVNMFGAMRMVKAFASLLVAADGAMIVNLGSVAPGYPLIFNAAYNASKAALHSYGDCLRIELRPFKIRVVTVMTGGVKSAITRRQHLDLPPDSLYRPVHEYWLKSLTLSQGGAMDTEKYAKYVVRKVVRGTKKPLLWKGRSAHRVRVLDTYFWKGFTDGLVSRQFGLDKLRKIVENKTGEKA